MYLPALRPQISQGDIFDNLPVARVKYPETVPVLKEIRGMLVTHDCEFDKKNSIYVLVTEVRLLKEVDTSSRGNIKNFKTLNTFFLVATDNIDESYLDFRRTFQIEKGFLLDRSAKSLRVKSLTDEARAALQRQLAIFFGHERRLHANGVRESSGAPAYDFSLKVSKE